MIIPNLIKYYRVQLFQAMQVWSWLNAHLIEIRVVGEIHQPEILNGEWQLSTDDPLIFLIRLLVHPLAMPILISSIVDPGNDIVPLCIKCYNNIITSKNTNMNYDNDI